MRKILINPDSGGQSKTIKANYWKTSLANFVRQDGFTTSAVLLVRRLC